MSQYLERPLQTLPAADAHAFVARLYAPDQRFARTFHRYWREVIGQSEDEASRSTARELAHFGGLLRANLSDPCVHTIGFATECGYQPIGLFALRSLLDHEHGRVLHEHLRVSGLLRRYPGRLAIAHAVAILNEHATRRALETILLSVARKAIASEFTFVLFYSSDLRLAALYRHYNIECPPELKLPESPHLVGIYQPTAPNNLALMARTAQRLGVALGAPAAL